MPSCSRNATGIRLSEPKDTARMIPRAETTFPEDAIPFFIAVSLSLPADSSLILDIDEAQYLKYSGNRYNNILAWAYDNLKNMHIIITGSEIGILEDFIDIDNLNNYLLYSRRCL